MAVESTGAETDSRRGPRRRWAAVRGRRVSSASVFSTLLLSSAVEDLAPELSGTVLDVGCGDAPYRRLVRSGSYVGLDWAFPGPGSQLDICASAVQLPLQDGSFDHALCTEVLEHVEYGSELCSELARVLRPTGSLLLSVPFVHHPHELPHDFRRLTACGIERSLTDAGLEVVSATTLGGRWVVIADLLIREVDASARRVGKRLGVLRLVEWLSCTGQRFLAEFVLLTRHRRPWTIKEMAADVRLSLGFVVLAERQDSMESSTARGGS